MTAPRKWRYPTGAMAAIAALFFSPDGWTASQAGLLIDARPASFHSQLLRVQAQAMTSAAFGSARRGSVSRSSRTAILCARNSEARQRIQA